MSLKKLLVEKSPFKMQLIQNRRICLIRDSRWSTRLWFFRASRIFSKKSYESNCSSTYWQRNKFKKNQFHFDSSPTHPRSIFWCLPFHFVSHTFQGNGIWAQRPPCIYVPVVSMGHQRSLVHDDLASELVVGNFSARTHCSYFDPLILSIKRCQRLRPW